MKLMEMRERAKDELEHIENGNLYQNMLRQVYFDMRMNSMGKKAKYPNDKNEILKISIQMIKKWAKKDKAEFNPQFDNKFFKTQ
ncbi:MAG TPA: hypothetical protein VI968_00840 [archaeon]|nr:hypothetical protein [archaeon]